MRQGQHRQGMKGARGLGEVTTTYYRGAPDPREPRRPVERDLLQSPKYLCPQPPKYRKDKLPRTTSVTPEGTLARDLSI